MTRDWMGITLSVALVAVGVWGIAVAAGMTWADMMHVGYVVWLFGVPTLVTLFGILGLWAFCGKGKGR